MKEHVKTIHVAVVILIMIFIFIQSALPADLSSMESNVIVQMLAQFVSIDPESISFVVRKAAHFTEYLILGCALVPVMREHGKKAILAWLIGSAYAVTDEIHQYFVSERSCEIRDMCIDSCGVLVGVLIGLLIIRLWAVRTRKQRIT